MQIADRCIGCRQCWVYCPVGAIGLASDGRRSAVNLDRCVECNTCLRARICPVSAFEQQELEYPRSLRSTFSDVMSPHKSTGVLGRGTEEMKTNDVTGRLPAGRINVSVELGRPGVSASFSDVQVLSRALARFGVHFQQENPVTSLICNIGTGDLRAEVLHERVLSALIEFDIEERRLPELVQVLHEAEKNVDTVFSVAAAEPIPQGAQEAPLLKLLAEHGIFHRPNGKTNVGLGRPLREVAP